MNKKLIVGMLLAANAMAQANLSGSQGLHRSENTQTLGKGVVQLGLGYETQTDGAMLQGGGYNKNGQWQSFSSDFPQVWVNALNLNAAVGLYKNFDLGLSLPVYLDNSDMGGSGVETYGAGIGDFRLRAKYLAYQGSIFSASTQAYAGLPTGTKAKGFFPKTRQSLESSSFNPFTAGDYVFGASVQGGINLNAAWNWPILLNANLGQEKSIGADYGITLLGAGLTYIASPHWDLFLEGSAELRNSNINNDKGVHYDPIWITPGLRYRYSDALSTSLALDWNPSDLHGRSGNLVSYGSDLSFSPTGSAPFAVSATLSWSFKAFDRDQDLDGVVDIMDHCANTPTGISVDPQGCPVDSDKDGVADYLDNCANTPAGVAVTSEGCPVDSDKDGIADYLDKCSKTPAGVVVTSEGCPVDSDKDGVADYLDNCVNTPAGVAVTSEGCPVDSDKDGVADYLDKCVNTPAGVAVTSEGCPVDSDKDGVADYLDKCPRTLKGVQIDSLGCPVKKSQDLTVLQGSINYKTGSAELTKSSFATLDKVVDLLKQIAEAKMEIQGHTDGKGDEAKNQALSQKRAENVSKYLVSKGITADRLSAKGFGSSVPVADNGTEEGRAKNRRTELVPLQN